MKKYLTGFALILSLAVVPVLAMAAPSDIDPSGQTTACPSLQNNLRYQSRDSQTNGEVSTLQDFLQSGGYLNSDPTGYFGLLTFQAAKSFQTANGISPTGYVGPITRAKIASMSNCGTSNNSPTPTPSPVQQTVKDPVITSVWSPANPASSFYPGDRVTIVGYYLPANASVYIGSTAIQAQSNATGYNITFYAPTTLSAGTYNLYVVGKATQSNKISVTVLARNNPSSNPTISYVQAPAEYQNILHAGERATVYGMNLPNSSNTNVFIGSTYSVYGQTSGDRSQFTFTVPSLPSGTYNLYIADQNSKTNSISITVPAANVIPVINSVYPSSASVSNSTQVTIYGTNFTSAAIVYLSNSQGSTPIQPSSVSGNSVAFTVPAGMTAGTYNLSVANGNPNGTLSNGISVAVAFTISAQPQSSVSLLSPISGETLISGQTYPIRWSSTGLNVVTINLLGNNGSQYGIASEISASTGVYNWTVPSNIPVGSGYRIAVGYMSTNDISTPSEAISIAAPQQPLTPFTITSPTSNSTLNAGQTYTATWTGGDAGVDNYSVYLVGGALGSTASLPLGTAYASQHSFSFTIPSTVQSGSGYQIQFSGRYVSGGNSPSFTIQGSQPASPFTITFPTSNSSLQIGQAYNVTWTGFDTGVDNYSVYLVGGSLGNTASIPLGTAYASNHTFSFTIPSSVQPGSGFQIQFSGKYVSGGNSSSFTITPPPPFTFTFPGSNTTLKIGQTYNVTWTGADTGVDNYSVYLVGGALGNTASVPLGTAYASQHSFSWTVPSSVQPASSYQIQFSGKYVTGGNTSSFTVSN